MPWKWNVIICSSDLGLILYGWDVDVLTRKRKIRQVHINKYVYVQIIGKSIETFLKDFQKTPIFSLFLLKILLH